MDETMRLSCPICRAIDWSRDGFTMAVDINGEIHRVRLVGPHPEQADARWQCERCGFQPAAGSALANHLTEMQISIVPKA
jgi:ribosomal protein S27AE